MAQALQKSQYAGEFQLESLKIFSPSREVFVDLLNICIQVDIFESIYTNSMTAQIIIVDTENIIDKLPIVGQEYVEMKLSSPNASDDFNTLDFSGDRELFVSSIANKEVVGGSGAFTYVLTLITKEFLINLNTRISKSYTDDISNIVRDLLKNKIGTRKKLNIEKTSGVRKIISPNLNPYTLINNLKREATSNIDLSPHYLFFENKHGFNFVSIQSLFSRPYIAKLHSGETVKDAKINISNASGRLNALSPDDSELMQAHKRILEHNFVPSKDIAMNLMSGMLGSTLITHDIYGKSYDKQEYNYFGDFKKFMRIESNPNPMYHPNLLQDLGNFRDSTIKLHPTSTVGGKDAQYYENEKTLYESNKPKNWVQQLKAKTVELENGQMINMTIHGNSLYTVGDIVELSFPITGQDHDDDKIDFASGNYLISKLRHSLTPPTNSHVIHMSVVRDCSRTII